MKKVQDGFYGLYNFQKHSSRFLSLSGSLSLPSWLSISALLSICLVPLPALAHIFVARPTLSCSFRARVPWASWAAGKKVIFPRNRESSRVDCPVLSCLVLPFLLFSSLTSSCLVLFLFCLVSSCLVLFCLILSCLLDNNSKQLGSLKSCLVLFYLVWWREREMYLRS